MARMPDRALFLTTADAAARLGLAPRTLERWRWAGRGPAFRKFGGCIRYALADLDAWADAGRRTSTSDAGPGPDRAA